MIPSAKNHPLLRDGQNQTHRAPPGLDPASAPLDGRGVPELLAETRDVASLITYYDLNLRPTGSWTPFFDRHAIVQLALVARDTSERFQTESSAGLSQLPSTDPAQQRTAILILARLLAKEAGSLARMGRALQATPFQQSISRALVASSIQPVRTGIEIAHAFLGTDGPAAVAAAATSLAETLWGWSAEGLLQASPGPAPSFEATRTAITTGIRQISRIRGFLCRAAQQALLSGTLENGDQPPHLGLFVACFRLFQHGQNAINDLLRRHLEYYYRDVVGFRAKAAQPDRAYVVFELARGTTAHLIPAGTQLLAGRDSAKQDIVFSLPFDAALNRARVDGLRTSRRNSTHWHYAAIANSSDGLGSELPKDNLRWPPFGNTALPSARVGWAIAAPVLELTTGQKSIGAIFTLTTEASELLWSRVQAALTAGGSTLVSNGSDGGTRLQSVVDLAVTGPKGWYVFPERAVVFYRSTRTLRVYSPTLEGDAAVTPYDPAMHLRAYNTRRPVFEILLRSGILAGVFEGLALESARVEVTVTGDTGLLLANDFGPLDAAKPFEPFGTRPTAIRGNSAGSRFLVGSRELFSKRLTSLSFDVEWKDMPEDLDSYYAGYYPVRRAERLTLEYVRDATGNFVEQRRKSPTDFKVELKYLDGATWQPLGSETHALFETNRLVVPSTELARFKGYPDLPAFDDYTAGQQRGFMRMELASPTFGFGHDRYPFLVTSAITVAVNDGSVPAEINTPVTPKIARFVANYTAEESLNLSANSGPDTFEFFHIEPHGEWRIAPSAGLPLAPVSEGDAAFFVGLADFTGGSNISLLFHQADGSGDPFVPYPEVKWSYLSGNEWKTFESYEVLYDSTLKLRRTGLLTLTVPAHATTAHTRMPGGRVWLRALATGDARALNLAYAVIPQAAEVKFSPTELNDLSRLLAPLPASTIKKLAVAQPQVKKISQPLASFDGEITESGGRFYRRSHERLRHRNRGCDLWDYERLILQAFPRLHLVKCIPHSTTESALAPGHILIVVVPETGDGQLIHPLQPAATQDLLEEVRAFVADRASGLARITVVNPLYEELQIMARVKLRAGNDVGLFSIKLAGELRSHLAPWVGGDSSALRFTNQIYPSQILNFIEERTYVDFVRDFTVRQWVGSTALSPDPAVLRATTARSILTSHPLHLLEVQ